MASFVQLISLFEVRLFFLVVSATLAVFSGIYLYRTVRSDTRRKIVALLGAIFVSLAVSGILGNGIINRVRGVPKVLFSSPANNNTILSHSPDIRVTFSAPVVYNTLAVHTNPEIEFSVRRQGYLWNLLPFGTTLTIVPKTTLPQGERLMVYFANIEGPATSGYGGEQLLEMNVDDMMASRVMPPDNSENVSTGQEVLVKFATPIRYPEEWKAESDPKHPLTLEKLDDRTFRIKPTEPFRQGAAYRIILIHSQIIKNRSDGNPVRTLDQRIKAEVRISTVRGAFISTFSPSGNAVNPKDPITIVFDQPMDKKSVEASIRVNPDVSLRNKWEEKTNTITLEHSGLTKDTEYKITLVKGLKTEQGGVLDSDAQFTFRTVGPLKLTDSNPANGDKNAQTNAVRLTFDQNVPSKITEYIDISPAIDGSFKVTGNVAEFTPKDNLKHQTAYTVKIGKDAPSEYGLPLPSDQVISFTTSEDQVQLTVPFYKQQTLFTCNIAAARMLLAFRGVSVTERDLIDKIGLGGKRGSGNPHKGYVDDFGTFWEAVLKGVTAYRSAHLLENGSLSDLLTEVKKGNPVMTWGWNGWSDPHSISWTSTDGTYINAVNGMHSMVVRGFSGSVDNPTKIYVNDPWRGQYTLDKDTFMRRWNYYKIALVME